MVGYIKLATLVVGASAALPKQYLTLTCDGALEMLPGHPMGMALDLSTIYSTFTNEIESSMEDYKTICKDMPEADLERALGYLYLENYILQFSPSGQSKLNASKSVMESFCDMTKITMETMTMPSLSNMPATCSYDDYVQGKPCSVQMPMPDSNVGLVFQAEQCPNSKFPALTLGCTGAGCDEFFRPCSSDADCTTGSKKCMPLPFGDIWTPMNSMLEEAMMFNASTDTACNTPTPYSMTVVNNLINHVMKKMGYDGTAPALTAGMNMSFCGISTAAEKILTDIASDVEADLEDCYSLNDNETCSDILADLPCTYSEDTGVDCSGLKAVDPIKQIKSDFGDWISVDGGVSLLRWDCEGYVQVLEQKNAAVQMRLKGGGFVSMLGVIAQTMSDSMKCRTGIAADTISTFIDYFSPWSLSFWTRLFFSPDATVLGGNTLQQVLLKSMKMDQKNLKNAPDSCNLQTLMAGKCDIALDISDLVKPAGAPWGGTTGLRLQVESCPVSGMMQGMLSCEGGAGSMCDIVKKPIGESTCNPADYEACGDGYACVDVNSQGFPFMIKKGDAFGNYMDEVTMANFLRKIVGKDPSASIAAVCLPLVDMDAMFEDKNMDKWMNKTVKMDNVTNTISFVTGGTVTKPKGAGTPLPDNTPGGNKGGGGPAVSAAPRTAALMASLLLPFAAFLLA